MLELRPYQKEAVRAINEHWNEWQRELLVLPTGCGKTVVFNTIANQRYIDNFRRSIDHIYDHRGIYKVLWQASIDRPIYQEMEDIIRRNILGTISSNPAGDQQITPYHVLYAELFASNLMTLVRWWLANETSVTRADVETLMTSNMKNGLFSTFKYRI